jgi:hypothetical protein
VGVLYEKGAEGQTLGRGDNGNKLLSAEARKQQGQVVGVAAGFGRCANSPEPIFLIRGLGALLLDQEPRLGPI